MMNEDIRVHVIRLMKKDMKDDTKDAAERLLWAMLKTLSERNEDLIRLDIPPRTEPNPV